MIGAIAGDIIGSPYEFSPLKTEVFPTFSHSSKFTDDTVLTIAVADALLHDYDLVDTLKDYSVRYPNRGYGGNYQKWIYSDSREPYNSWGNGSAMRTSPVGFIYNSENEVLQAAKACAEVTHNHAYGIRGAQAVSLCIFLARCGAKKEYIQSEISHWFNYDLFQSIDEIRPKYYFDVSCQGSVPQSIIAFLESENYEDAVRKAISLGGDADTMACIAGGIAEAYYKEIPEFILSETRGRLPVEFQKIVDEFYQAVE